MKEKSVSDQINAELSLLEYTFLVNLINLEVDKPVSTMQCFLLILLLYILLRENVLRQTSNHQNLVLQRLKVKLLDWEMR